MPPGDGIRRNVAQIPDEERGRLINAFLALDTTKIYPDGVTYWDKQEEIHKNAHAAGQDVHGGPAFVPWHRELCNRLEGLLRQVDPRLSLHYWDWTTDPRVATADRVKLFTHACMGDDGGEGINRVPADGGGDAGIPFQDFETTEGGGHNFIWRNVGATAGKPSGEPNLDSDATILDPTTFTAFDT